MARTGLKEIFAAVRSGLLTDAELAAWMLIRSYEGSDGGCTASEETLAASRGVDPRQWRRLKAILVEKGFLETRRRGPTTPLLRTKLPDDRQDRTRGVRPREDIDSPVSDGQTGQRASGQSKRPDTRPDVRPDTERPPSIGVKELKDKNIRKVFDVCRELREERIGKTSGPSLQFTKARSAMIRARLKDGFTVEEMEDCARGFYADTWEGRDRYLDPKYAFRDDDTVRRYIDLHRGRNRRGGGPHYDRREDLP